MCGRAYISTSANALYQGPVQSISKTKWKEATASFSPKFSSAPFKTESTVSPGQILPVLRCVSSNGGSSRSSPEFLFEPMLWGLISPYNKNPAVEPGDFFKMFNARSETMHEKPSFKNLLSTRRCIVFFDGYFEWKGLKGQKQPFYIHEHVGNPLKAAGLYDINKYNGVTSVTIITQAPYDIGLESVHDRQPVFLDEQEAAEWLGYQDFATLKKRLRKKNFHHYPVSNKINSSSYQGDASAINPISLPGTQDPTKKMNEPNVNILNFLCRIEGESRVAVKREASNLSPAVEEYSHQEDIVKKKMSDRDIMEIAALGSVEKGATHSMTDDQEITRLAFGEIDDKEDNRQNYEECFICFKKIKRSVLQEHVNACLDNQHSVCDSTSTQTSPLKRNCSQSSSKSPSNDNTNKKQRSIYDFVDAIN